MAWTQAQVDALDDAIRSNVSKVRFPDGREVEYRSMDELLKARNLAVSAVSSSSSSVRATYGKFVKD